MEELAEIQAEALRRYPINPGMCRTQKMKQQGKQEAYIKRESEKLKQLPTAERR